MTTAFDNPILYDAVAQGIIALSSDVFDDCYPVCFTGQEEDETFPVVYENDGSRVNLRVLPTDTRSMCFFTIEGELDDMDDYHLRVPMAMTCWLNLETYNTSSDYNFDYTSEVVRDVFNIIRNYGGYDMKVNVHDPFEGFTMLQPRTNMMRPYSGFKISFSINKRVCST